MGPSKYASSTCVHLLSISRGQLSERYHVALPSLVSCRISNRVCSSVMQDAVQLGQVLLGRSGLDLCSQRAPPLMVMDLKEPLKRWHCFRQLRVRRQVRSPAICAVDRNLAQKCLRAGSAPCVPRFLHVPKRSCKTGPARRCNSAWPEPE